MNSSDRVFVAGHRGMVGSAIMRRLQREASVSLIAAPRDRLDLTDPAAVLHFFQQERPEYVFLTAAKVGGILANDTQPVEFLHVDDLADACVFLMRNYSAAGPIDVGVGKDLAVRELAEMVSSIVGYRGSVRWDRSKPDGHTAQTARRRQAPRPRLARVHVAS